MMGQASICFGLASFSLYLPRFYHFSFRIKRTKSKVIPKPDAAIASEQKAQAIFSKIDDLVKKLQTSANAGNKEARNKLNFFRWDTMRAQMRDLEKMSKAGQHASPPPIRTILEMADFAIPLLLLLSKSQTQNIQEYARLRWSWPAYVDVIKQGEKPYRELKPKFNQAGTKIIKESPISLGSEIGLNFSNRTNRDYLFGVAAGAIRQVAFIEEVKKDLLGPNWFWLRVHKRSLQKKKAVEFNIAAEKFLLSLGKFSRQNWSKWEPVFDTFLTLHGGPLDERFNRLPKDWQSDYSALAWTRQIADRIFERSRSRRFLSARLRQNLRMQSGFRRLRLPPVSQLTPRSFLQFAGWR